MVVVEGVIADSSERYGLPFVSENQHVEVYVCLRGQRQKIFATGCVIPFLKNRVSHHMHNLRELRNSHRQYSVSQLKQHIFTHVDNSPTITHLYWPTIISG